MFLLVAAWTVGLGRPVRAAAGAGAPGVFEVDPRVEVALWASEPEVVDPVSICFDESGRAYVAECRDYPYGAGPDGAVGSTVRLLEDTDGDGRADKSTLFAGGLSYATSVTPWRGGVLVAVPPEVVWLKDTNGDGVADVREVVLRGFRRGVSDSLVNGLQYGLDNRIHGANGGNGGRLTVPARPDEALDLGDDDFAWDPRTGRVARTGESGGGFGLVFDDWGRAFTTYNIDHFQHRFLTREQAGRHPGFPAVDLTGSISDHEEMSRIFPVSVAQTRPNHPEQAGRFSAAGGMGRVASAAWPEDLRGSVFVCDVVGNLVHRDLVVPDGPVFRATRAPGEQAREFLASRDPAFRPVGLETGPDGALYLLDMQREVIEHPDYIPAKVREKLDVRAGDRRGRIYRLTPKGGLPVVRPGLATKPDAELVPLLGHADAWWRLTAQRLLVERRATGQVESLRRWRRKGPPAGRLHALWTLEGLGRLESDDVEAALDDAHPGVRENALTLFEGRAGAFAGLAEKVRRRAADPDARVRFRAALALGTVPDAASASALAELLGKDAADPWMRRAIWASLPPEHQRAAGRWLAGGALGAGVRADLVAEYAEWVGARAGQQPGDVSWCLAQLAPGMSPEARRRGLAGLAAGLARSSSRPVLEPAAVERLAELAGRAERAEMEALWRLTRQLGRDDLPAQQEAVAAARRGATNQTAGVERRAADIALLEFAPAAEATPVLLGLLEGREPEAIQGAALAVLRRRQAPEVGAALVARWRSLGPALRPRVLELLLARSAFHEPLVDALEKGRLTPGELNLDLEQRRRLLRGGPPEVRRRAARLVSDEEYGNRRRVVDEWLARLPGAGEAARGRKVFEEACARCHRCGNAGRRVGPELTAMSHRSVEDLLSNVLDPNMAINPGFVAYSAETRDGESAVGLLAAESPAEVVLLQADEVRVTIPRKDLVRLESSGASLMPEGLEAGRTPQELRDLIAFLQESR